MYNDLGREGDATFFHYPACTSSARGLAPFAANQRDAHVVHVISPRLHGLPAATVVRALGDAYAQVFQQACLAGLGPTGVLRLSMLSANINAGSWKSDIAAATVLDVTVAGVVDY